MPGGCHPAVRRYIPRKSAFSHFRRGASPQTYCPKRRSVPIMFISPAFAQAVGGASSGAIVQFLPLVLIFVVFYFLLIRPQQKRAKAHQAMLGALRRGDKVVTGGGILGTVAKVEGDEILVDLAPNVRVSVVRGTITEIRAKTGDAAEPAETKTPAAK
jgi:preprotein translocase subunit YajC